MPSWLDVDTLLWLIPVVILGLFGLMFIVFRFVTQLVTKAILLALLAALVVGLWVQREDLGDCVDTCTCRLFGQDVEVPDSSNPNC